MDEYDNILYDLGYYSGDPQKKEQIKRYVSEAEEFMKAAGVPTDKITSYRAYAIKSLWADARDKGTATKIISSDTMIVHLISQLRLGGK